MGRRGKLATNYSFETVLTQAASTPTGAILLEGGNEPLILDIPLFGSFSSKSEAASSRAVRQTLEWIGAQVGIAALTGHAPRRGFAEDFAKMPDSAVANGTRM